MNTEMWYEFAWDRMFFTATFKKAVGTSALLAPDIEALMPDPDRRVRLPHLSKQAGRPKKKRMRTRGEGADWRNQRRKAVPKCRYVLSCSFVEKAPGERRVGDAPTCFGMLPYCRMHGGLICLKRGAELQRRVCGDGTQPVPSGGPHSPFVHQQRACAVGLRLRS